VRGRAVGREGERENAAHPLVGPVASVVVVVVVSIVAIADLPEEGRDAREHGCRAGCGMEDRRERGGGRGRERERERLGGAIARALSCASRAPRPTQHADAPNLPHTHVPQRDVRGEWRARAAPLHPRSREGEQGVGGAPEGRFDRPSRPSDRGTDPSDRGARACAEGERSAPRRRALFVVVREPPSCKQPWVVPFTPTL
jgi:hypothetical protein